MQCSLGDVLKCSGTDILPKQWIVSPIRTPLGRARAWLRLALMQKKLADYLRCLITRKDLLRYTPFSLSFPYHSISSRVSSLCLSPPPPPQLSLALSLRSAVWIGSGYPKKQPDLI